MTWILASDWLINVNLLLWGAWSVQWGNIYILNYPHNEKLHPKSTFKEMPPFNNLHKGVLRDLLIDLYFFARIKLNPKKRQAYIHLQISKRKNVMQVKWNNRFNKLKERGSYILRLRWAEFAWPGPTRLFTPWHCNTELCHVTSNTELWPGYTPEIEIGSASTISICNNSREESIF